MKSGHERSQSERRTDKYHSRARVGYLVGGMKFSPGASLEGRVASETLPGCTPCVSTSACGNCDTNHFDAALHVKVHIRVVLPIYNVTDLRC